MAEYKLILTEQPKSPIAEAYRSLRTNLQYAKVDGELKSILYTSTGPGEGKSTTIANTAIALAQSGRRVILVDCDLRKPVLHKIFRLSRNSGVTNILAEDSHPAEYIQDTDIENLQILSSGPIPPNPSELLGSKRMKKLLSYVREQADMVLIDSPPAVAVTDASVLASQVDGITLVVDAGTVRPEIAQRAKELLTHANGRILGVILNRAEIDEEHAYYYYYYGSGNK